MTNPVSGKALAAGSESSTRGKALVAGSESSTRGKALAAGSESSTRGKAPAAGSESSTRGKAPAAGEFPHALFITWTTCGTWLPGDHRGWRNWKRGQRPPQPRLEEWCRDRLREQPVLLDEVQRDAVENVIREHAEFRHWVLHAVSARSNHVHIAVSAAAIPKQVRDQLKANATRALRSLPDPISNEKVWTRGGDIEFIDTNENLEKVIIYITESQDRMDRGK